MPNNLPLQPRRQPWQCRPPPTTTTTFVVASSRVFFGIVVVIFNVTDFCPVIKPVQIMNHKFNFFHRTTVGFLCHQNAYLTKKDQCSVPSTCSAKRSVKRSIKCSITCSITCSRKGKNENVNKTMQQVTEVHEKDNTKHAHTHTIAVGQLDNHDGLFVFVVHSTCSGGSS